LLSKADAGVRRPAERRFGAKNKKTKNMRAIAKIFAKGFFGGL
jgi:hypothetical protein